MTAIEQIVDDFRKRRPIYEAFTDKLDDLLRALLHVHGIPASVESRTKSLDSFGKKIQRPGKSYQDPLSEVTDLAALRVITRTTIDVGRVEKMLAEEFSIDWSRSVNKALELDPTHFGYLSKHFIVSLNARRAESSEWRAYGSLVAEIQVRTFVQHAWANVQRALEYTRESDIPGPLRRRLYRLSALFELADDELEYIWREGSLLTAEYEDKIRRGVVVELNLDSYRVFLQESRQIAQIADFIRALGVRVDGPGSLSRDIEVMRLVGFKSVDDIEGLLSRTRTWSKLLFEDFMRSHHAAAIAVGGLSFDLNGIVLFLVLAAHPNVFTAEVLERVCGFGKPEQLLSSAARTRPV